jgi:hypothetical protein
LGSAGLPYPQSQPLTNEREIMTDNVNHPAHYTKGSIETIDYIVDVLGDVDALSYCHGNVIKYTGTRLRHKGNTIEDAKKAVWYLNKMIKIMEASDNG